MRNEVVEKVVIVAVLDMLRYVEVPSRSTKEKLVICSEVLGECGLRVNDKILF